ncbi:MAG: universal stress protein [Cytophagaceae bacterium]
MKNILCPIDFTSASETAVDYARELANATTARLIFLHLYHITPVEPGTASYLSNDIVTQAENRAKEEMAKLVGTVKNKYSTLEVDTIIRYGLPEEEIPAVVEENEIDAVVMGTKGATGLKKILFGSITANVVDEAECPVFVIPSGYQYQPFKEIVYATDLEGMEDKAVNYVVKLAELFNANLNFFSVKKAEEKKSAEEVIKYAFEHLLINYNYPNLTFSLSEAGEVEEGIRDFVKEKNADLLVMATHERNFFQKIFGKSHTKEIIYQPEIPVLSVHKMEEKPVHKK